MVVAKKYVLKLLLTEHTLYIQLETLICIFPIFRLILQINFNSPSENFNVEYLKIPTDRKKEFLKRIQT